MPYRDSEIKAKTARHLVRLRGRLEALTESYAAFFGGFGIGYKSARNEYGPGLVTVLTDLQNLRRAQLTPLAYEQASSTCEIDEENETFDGQDDAMRAASLR